MPSESAPEIVVIAAVAEENRTIGRDLDLPWHLPKDLKRFKSLTLGHPLVMGRRTFESLLHQFGGPLKGRENVVLTRHPVRVEHAGIAVYASLEEALAAQADRERVFIGGGAAVYEAALPFAHRLELTLVEGAFEGDTYFPPFRHLLAPEGGPFRLEASERHPAEGDRPAFRFETWVRAA